MCQLISIVQTTYIPGSCIEKNILLTFDVVEYVNGASTPGMIVVMVIDFEAAFDTVPWYFLAEALGYNFGPNIRP